MITIETINGKPHTVVWHTELPIRFMENVLPCHWIAAPFGAMLTKSGRIGGLTNVVATALPALPLHPKPEDAKLLHLYAAHGLDVTAAVAGCLKPRNRNPLEYLFRTDIEVTHALHNGERVEIAIEGGE